MSRVLRVTGADESYLWAADLLGVHAPIQYLWVFDEDPGTASVDRLRAGLAAGPLHRMVVRRRFPLARHRWVRSDKVVPVAPVPTIEPGDVDAWAESTLRNADLDPVAGLAWRLDSATTTAGGRVVSLLASHMVTDGQGLFRLIDAALDGATHLDGVVPMDGGGLGRVREDAADAWTNLCAAVRSSSILLRRALASRARRGDAESRRWALNRAGPPPAPDARINVPDTTLLLVDVDRDEWQQCAEHHGGSPNSLFTAILAGIVRRSGFVPAGPATMCIAVSYRVEGDVRANASGGVWIRVDPVGPAEGLTAIRKASKQAFENYSRSDSEPTSDLFQPLLRLLPRSVMKRAVSHIPGPDATVSNLGEVPDRSLCINGRRAHRFALRAVMIGLPVGQRRRGPAIAAWAAAYDDTVTLSFFGLDPEHFGDVECTRALVESELGAWNISYRNW